jgi:hypothetical protein
MLLSAVAVLAVAQPSSEVPEGLTNYPVYEYYMCELYMNSYSLPEDEHLDVRNMSKTLQLH